VRPQKVAVAIKRNANLTGDVPTGSPPLGQAEGSRPIAADADLPMHRFMQIQRMIDLLLSGIGLSYPAGGPRVSGRSGGQ